MTAQPASTSGTDPTHETGEPGRLLPTNRLEAFSDGVFAIVVTLLVLELEVPTGTHLWHELASGWPGYLGYGVSFAFVGGAWIAHSTLTRFIQAADPVLLRLNLVLLLMVSLLPFTTNLMATHLTDPGEGTAVVVFGVNITLAALMVNVCVAYAARMPGLAADDYAEEELRAFERERRLALLLQAVATAVALFLPVVAVLVFLGISVLLLVDPLFRARHRRLRHARAR